MSESLQISQLSRSFGATSILSGIELSLPAGERLAVIGASGSGKTTLLRLISGLETPTSGDIVIAGQLVSRSGQIVVSPEKRNVAMVFQGLALIPHLNALEQIAFAARGRDRRQRAKHLLDRVGLSQRSHAMLDQLSGGERQRIALARALAQEPALLLMDEPFASLDDFRREEMRELLRSLLQETRATLILVTHSHEDALSLANRVLILDSGRPIFCGTLNEVLTDPRHVFAVRSLGLGQVIAGQTIDEHRVQTAFGVLQSSRELAPGHARLLVRPAQARLSPTGVEAEIISIELRASDLRNEIVQIACVRRGNDTLRINLDLGEFAVGQRVRLAVEGVCAPIES